jgi:hypothetical protein
MRAFITCILVVGPAVLLIVALLSIVHDLLSSSAFAAPDSPNEENAPLALGRELAPRSQPSHSGLLEPRGTSTVRKSPGVRDRTTWSVKP